MKKYQINEEEEAITKKKQHVTMQKVQRRKLNEDRKSAMENEVAQNPDDMLIVSKQIKRNKEYEHK
jgi:hypothetical protein